MRYKYLFGIIILFFSFVVIYLSAMTRDERMMNKGNDLVKKVEAYKHTHGELPDSLEDIGLKEEDGYDVLYYERRDSAHYCISFSISAEEHKYYYSDTRKWEYHYRAM